MDQEPVVAVVVLLRRAGWLVGCLVGWVFEWEREEKKHPP